MADLYMANAGLTSDIDNMNTAAKNMNQAIDDFADDANSGLALLEGRFKEQLQTDLAQFVKTVQTTTSNFGNGIGILNNMANIVNNGDNRAANIMGA